MLETDEESGEEEKKETILAPGLNFFQTVPLLTLLFQVLFYTCLIFVSTSSNSTYRDL